MMTPPEKRRERREFFAYNQIHMESAAKFLFEMLRGTNALERQRVSTNGNLALPDSEEISKQSRECSLRVKEAETESKFRNFTCRDPCDTIHNRWQMASAYKWEKIRNVSDV